MIGGLDTHDGTLPGARERDRRGGRVGRLPARPRASVPGSGRRRGRRARVGAQANADELGVDPARIAVAGDSAGGNLAAVVAQVARDQGGPPIVLPAADLPGDRPRVRQRVDERQRRGVLPHPRRDALVLPPLPRTTRPRARTPACRRSGPTNLAGLPPAFVITAEFDPLRDQGVAYAERDCGRGHAVRRAAPTTACSTGSSAWSSGSTPGRSRSTTRSPRSTPASAGRSASMAVIDLAGFVADLKDHAVEHGFHVHDERHFVESYSLRQNWEVDLHPEEGCEGPLDLYLSLEVDPRVLLGFEDAVIARDGLEDPPDEFFLPLSFTWALPAAAEGTGSARARHGARGDRRPRPAARGLGDRLLPVGHRRAGDAACGWSRTRGCRCCGSATAKRCRARRSTAACSSAETCWRVRGTGSASG